MYEHSVDTVLPWSRAGNFDASKMLKSADPSSTADGRGQTIRKAASATACSSWRNSSNRLSVQVALQISAAGITTSPRAAHKGNWQTFSASSRRGLFAFWMTSAAWRRKPSS